MNSDDKSLTITICTVFAFLTILVLSSCVKDQSRMFNAQEAYVACIEAQKSVEIDLKCGIGGNK